MYRSRLSRDRALCQKRPLSQFHGQHQWSLLLCGHSCKQRYTRCSVAEFSTRGAAGSGSEQFPWAARVAVSLSIVGRVRNIFLRASLRMDSHIAMNFHHHFVCFLCSGVGKSCSLFRFVNGSFSDRFISSIGVEFRIRTADLDLKGATAAKLQIWDTAVLARFGRLCVCSFLDSRLRRAPPTASVILALCASFQFVRFIQNSTPSASA
jgi:hypothetical protein